MSTPPAKCWVPRLAGRRTRTARASPPRSRSGSSWERRSSSCNAYRWRRRFRPPVPSFASGSGHRVEIRSQAADLFGRQLTRSFIHDREIGIVLLVVHAGPIPRAIRIGFELPTRINGLLPTNGRIARDWITRTGRSMARAASGERARCIPIAIERFAELRLVTRGAADWRLRRVVRREVDDVGIGQRVGDGLHLRARARTGTEQLHLFCKVGRSLSCERRPLWSLAVAVRAVAGVAVELRASHLAPGGIAGHNCRGGPCARSLTCSHGDGRHSLTTHCTRGENGHGHYQSHCTLERSDEFVGSYYGSGTNVT